MDVEAVRASDEALRLVPQEFATENRVLPIELKADGRCRVAVTDFHPDNELAERLSSVTGRLVEFVLVVNDGDLDEPIRRAYGSRQGEGGYLAG